MLSSCSKPLKYTLKQTPPCGFYCLRGGEKLRFLCNFASHHRKTLLQSCKSVSHHCTGRCSVAKWSRIVTKGIYTNAKRPRTIAKHICSIVSCPCSGAGHDCTAILYGVLLAVVLVAALLEDEGVGAVGQAGDGEHVVDNAEAVHIAAADNKYLQGLLPSNNYSIGGSISLNQNPVIKVDDRQAEILLEDFHRLRDRLNDRHLLFYREMMGSLCLTMMYDIFELHARRDATDTHSDRTAIIVRQLTDLLATGISRTERDVSYYAERLNVSTKYLSATVKRVTGHSVSSFIDRATVPILKKYLNNERLSLTQIADRMNFTSLSYFSRYCTKHLGQSPSDYRRSLQPRG